MTWAGSGDMNVCDEVRELKTYMAAVVADGEGELVYGRRCADCDMVRRA